MEKPKSATSGAPRTARSETRCDRCNAKFAIKLPYGPHKLCEKHFTKFFDNRFKKTIRKYSLFKPQENILIALSGGKDSVALLHLMNKYYSKSNPLQALIIDEGVKGYRDKSVKVAIENCDKLKIPYKVVSFEKEFGINNDEIMPLILANPKLGGTCAFCGTLRRNLMNRYAKKLNANKLATGHNLDDEVQSFVMNVFNNDFSRFKRIGANSGIIEHNGFVKRIKPLYETPEKEIVAYCAINKINHYSQDCCPYSWTAKRNEYRMMLNNFENRFPGTQHSALRFFENMKKEIMPTPTEKTILKNKLIECTICGEPTEKKLCKTCEMIELLKSEKKTQKNNKTKKPKSINSKYNQSLTCSTTKGI